MSHLPGKAHVAADPDHERASASIRALPLPDASPLETM
jgi:hypothetical protein